MSPGQARTAPRVEPSEYRGRLGVVVTLLNQVGEVGTIFGMGLVWVTGNSGSGKSSVCEVLNAMGHRAIDTDLEGYSRWVCRDSGEVVDELPHPVPDRYAWRIEAELVRELAIESGSSLVFLCGSVENSSDILDYFDQIVSLVADDETIERRLLTRTTNSFGKHPDELADVLAWNQTVADRWRARGASIVDSTRPLAEVVRAVLDIAGVVDP
jgi:shikimate kinase